MRKITNLDSTSALSRVAPVQRPVKFIKIKYKVLYNQKSTQKKKAKVENKYIDVLKLMT